MKNNIIDIKDIYYCKTDKVLKFYIKYEDCYYAVCGLKKSEKSTILFEPFYHTDKMGNYVFSPNKAQIIFQVSERAEKLFYKFSDYAKLIGQIYEIPKHRNRIFAKLLKKIEKNNERWLFEENEMKQKGDVDWPFEESKMEGKCQLNDK